MAKTYIVRLAPEERLALETMIKKGRAAGRKIRHANALLKADADAGWTDKRIADAFGRHYRSVENVRKRLVLEGLGAALNRKEQRRPSREPELDGEKQAKLIAVACSAPPEARRRWTLRLLADTLVELDSWLNIAEIELNVLSRQCLAGRIPDKDTLTRGVTAWEQQRNGKQRGLNWRLTTDDARIKLRRLYPQVQG